MKSKFKILIFLFFLVILFIFIIALKIETVTGEFLLTKPFFSFIPFLFSFIIIFLLVEEVVKEDTQRKFHRLLNDLFEYSDKIVIGKQIEYQNRLNETAREFVNLAREIAKEYHIKLRVLDKERAEEKLLALLFKMYDIKHRKAHEGARYVHEMRENPQDLSSVKAGLKFLSDIRPQEYGDVAKDLYDIIKKLYR